MFVVIHPRCTVRLPDSEDAGSGPHPEGSVIEVSADKAKQLEDEGKASKLNAKSRGAAVKEAGKAYHDLARSLYYDEFKVPKQDRNRKGVPDAAVRQVYGAAIGFEPGDDKEG